MNHALEVHQESADLVAEPARSQPEAAPKSTGTVIREVNLEQNSFGIRVADTEVGRSSASMLINKMYAWRGYAGSHKVEQNPNRITLHATNNADGATLGTVTLNIDSEIGILADGIFRDQIDAFRAKGAKVCEITKLAFDSEGSSKMALASLFHILYIYARHLHHCTDAFIEVNPRHRRFYQSMLDFTKLGDVRENTRVNAPAYLMWINLDKMCELIKTHGGTSDHPAIERSLYPCFFSQREEEGIINRLLNLDKS